MKPKFKLFDLVHVIDVNKEQPDGEINGIDFLKEKFLYKVGGTWYYENEIELVPPRLKIWLLTQNDVTGYDTFDSCVVCAYTEDEAKNMSPEYDGTFKGHCWARSPDVVEALCIGIATEGLETGFFVCKSFNAG